MDTSLTTTDGSTIFPATNSSQDEINEHLGHMRWLQATGDFKLLADYKDSLATRYGDKNTFEIKEEIQQETNEKLTQNIDNEIMETEPTNNTNSKIRDRRLDLALAGIGVIIGVLGLFVTIVYSSLSQNVTTMQAIREETVAKVSESNSKVLSEVQGMRSDMQNFRSEINQKFEMQDLKTENKILKEKKSK